MLKKQQLKTQKEVVDKKQLTKFSGKNIKESKYEEVIEGELPAEGESPEEGEAPLFTSADPAQRGVYDETLDGVPTPDAGEENEGGKESRELVEPDVIRRAGNLLYILNQHRGLIIADLDGQRTLSQTPTFGYPRDLYLVGNKAYVLVSYAQDVRLDEKG